MHTHVDRSSHRCSPSYKFSTDRPTQKTNSCFQFSTKYVTDEVQVARVYNPTKLLAHLYMHQHSEEPLTRWMMSGQRQSVVGAMLIEWKSEHCDSVPWKNGTCLQVLSNARHRTINCTDMGKHFILIRFEGNGAPQANTRTHICPHASSGVHTGAPQVLTPLITCTVLLVDVTSEGIVDVVKSSSPPCWCMYGYVLEEHLCELSWCFFHAGVVHEHC